MAEDNLKSPHTPGPWQLIIDDTGGKWTMWPTCIDTVKRYDEVDGKTIINAEGFRPRSWDIKMELDEIHANAVLITNAPLMYDYIEKMAQQGDVTAQKIIMNICGPTEGMQTAWVGAIE